MNRKLNNARKNLSKLQDQRSKIAQELQALQEQASNIVELDQLESAENKASSRKRLLVVLGDRIAAARIDIDQAQGAANEAQAQAARKREKESLDQALKLMRQLNSALGELDVIKEELIRLDVSPRLNISPELEKALQWQLDHLKSYHPDLLGLPKRNPIDDEKRIITERIAYFQAEIAKLKNKRNTSAAIDRYKDSIAAQKRRLAAL